MRLCPVCGKEITQDNLEFCSYCGASLVLQHAGASGTTTSTIPAPQAPYFSSERLSFDLSERYERAMRKVERLGTLVLILSIIILILII